MTGDLGTVLAPPYDVISADAQRALYDHSPYNVVRLEYALETVGAGASRYQTAAETLHLWRRQGVLAADAKPSLYLYEQRFEHGGKQYRRRSIIGRVRLEPWDAGVVRAHEHTLAAPKQDRLELLRACRTDVSPVLGLYRSDGGRAVSICETAATADPAVDATDITGQRHTLWAVDNTEAAEKLGAHFLGQTLYVADGHHRYETALAYRDEQRLAASTWTGEEPENFVLMALTAADDPGLLILPIHRLVRPAQTPTSLHDALAESFDIFDQTTESLPNVLERLQLEATGRPALACLGPGRSAFVLKVRSSEAIGRRMPAGHSNAWRQLAVNVLQYGILEPLLGIDIEAVRAGGRVDFTESAEEALDAVQAGEVPLAFLLNATRPDEIFAVADAGDRMPQKSTYFYPKLGTGLVLYSMDA